jgi:hypothetical protein
MCKAVMQSTDLRKRDDLATLRRFDFTMLRTISVQRKVGAGRVVVLNIRAGFSAGAVR